MALKNSSTNEIRRTYSIEDLKDAAKLMRGYDLVALNAAGSGHAGGTLSIMDIAAALYLRVADHDPENPNWPDRDRIVWSTGHKAPSLYLGLAFAGFCPIEDVVLLRKLGSPYQGHPHWLKLPGVEVSTGSLGQGLSIAVGLALAGKLNGKNHKVFCIMGDGEQQEGQIWEAAMAAAFLRVDNLVAIVDRNGLQITGSTEDVCQLAPLDQKFAAFGFEVCRCDGNDVSDLVRTLEEVPFRPGKPSLILAKTKKGKGVSFMENVAKWHHKVPSDDEYSRAMAELDTVEAALK